MQTIEKLFTLTHVIANADPQQCYNEVEKFIENKNEVQLHWNTSAVVTGVQMIANQPQAQTTIITTCLIIWRANAEQKNQFVLSQKFKV